MLINAIGAHEMVENYSFVRLPCLTGSRKWGFASFRSVRSTSYRRLRRFCRSNEAIIRLPSQKRIGSLCPLSPRPCLSSFRFVCRDVQLFFFCSFLRREMTHSNRVTGVLTVSCFLFGLEGRHIAF